MTDETALGAELRRTGYDSNEMRFLSALSLYLNNGGTIPRAQKLVEIAAAKLLGEGRNADAIGGQENFADARQQNDGGEGQALRADGGPKKPASPAVAEREGEARFYEPKGHWAPANPSPSIANGKGHATDANRGQPTCVPPARETVSAAGRILQSVRKPGAGALQARAYETQARIRGESWLLSYAYPDGPLAVESRYADLEPMFRRNAREGAKHAFAAAVAHRLKVEMDKAGRCAPDLVVSKTLPPSVLAKIAADLEPQAIAAKARDVLRHFATEQIGGAQ